MSTQKSKIHLVEDEEAPSVSVGPLGTSCCSIVRVGDHNLRFAVVVTLETYEDVIIASWPALNAWGEGDTPTDAVFALKANVGNLWESLRATDDDELGAELLEAKRVLETLL